MSPTLQEAIQALKPFFTLTQTTKPGNIVKVLSGRFKVALRKGESSSKAIRAMRNSSYGII